MTGTLRLSVGIPTYNSAQFLPAAINSVLTQNIDDYEIVIIDNASQDDTTAVVESFHNDRIRYFRNDTNMGMAGSWNRCIAEARGTYFKFLCADDVLLDGVLAKQIALLESQPRLSLVTCDICYTDADLKPFASSKNLPGLRNGRSVINACLSGLSNYVGCPSSIMFPRSAARGICIDGAYRFILDLKFMFQLLERGDYGSINVEGMLFRMHESSETAKGNLNSIRVSEYLRLAEDLGFLNLLSCVQAMRTGGSAEREFVRRRWIKTLHPGSLVRSIFALKDVVAMRWGRSRG